jgi:hypothetical protein
LSETSIPIQSLVAGLVAVILVQEYGIYRQSSASDPPTERGLLYLALGLMAVAVAFSLADLSRVWCDPSNHWLQGHSVWHLLTALALYTLFMFYARIPERPAS